MADASTCKAALILSRRAGSMNVDRRCSRSQREREGILSPSSWGGPTGSCFGSCRAKHGAPALRCLIPSAFRGFNLQHPIPGIPTGLCNAIARPNESNTGALTISVRAHVPLVHRITGTLQGPPREKTNKDGHQCTKSDRQFGKPGCKSIGYGRLSSESCTGSVGHEVHPEAAPTRAFSHEHCYFATFKLLCSMPLHLCAIK